MAETQREIESKFDVAPDFAVPALEPLVPGGPRPGRIDVVVSQLDSQYFDTPNGDLHRSRLTLRRRTGTDDTGWHLKVPGDGFRTELRWPLANPDGPESADTGAGAPAADEMPGELRRLLAPFTGAAAIGPSVQLRVHRTRHRIVDADGALIVELADDQVRATDAAADDAPAATPRWRELEAELGPSGTAADLRRVGELVQTAQAVPSRWPSKYSRALLGGPPPGPPGDTAGDAVARFLRTQFDALTAGCLSVALGGPEAIDAPSDDSVHQTRVAGRRIRAVLRVFGKLFDPAEAKAFDGELRWWSGLLGELRDREVLRDALLRSVEELPAYLVVGPVADQISAVLRHEYADGLAEVHAVMTSRRFAQLVATTARWSAAPPFTELAAGPATELSDLLAHAEHALRRRARALTERHPEPDALHRIRKAAKRIRYAAEAVRPAIGAVAKRHVRAASELQTVLGEYQDAVVATTLLRRIADQIADDGGNAFTYGLLVGEQRRRASESLNQARVQFGHQPADGTSRT